MATYDIRTLQLHILEILTVADRVCREHNLRYYIVDGTMLGALRHKGFIPWDDDIDIGIPRKDYDLLIKHASEWLPAPYELICGENDANYYLPFAKIQDSNTTLIDRISFKYIGGAYIDVFPLDGFPENKLKQRFHYTKFNIFNKLLYFTLRDPYKHGHGISSWLPRLCQKVFKPCRVQRAIRNIQTKYDYDKCNIIINYDDRLRGVMAKEILGDPTPVAFEEKQFMGVGHYDTYLKKLYGDYMRIPPKNKQRQHNFYYLDLNTPYKDYLNNTQHK